MGLSESRDHTAEQESTWRYENDDLTVVVRKHTPGQYNGWEETTEFPADNKTWLGRIEFHPDPTYETPRDQGISLKLGLTNFLREMTYKGRTVPAYLYMLVPQSSRGFPRDEAASFGFTVIDPNPKSGGDDRKLFVAARTEHVQSKFREAGRL